jgi:prevent-host-death family protein
MATVVTATDLRTKIREIIQRAQFQNDHVIVTVFDKPAVAIIGINDYHDYLVHKEHQQQQGRERWERLRAVVEQDATLDELTDEQLQALIDRVRSAG